MISNSILLIGAFVLITVLLVIFTVRLEIKRPIYLFCCLFLCIVGLTAIAKKSRHVIDHPSKTKAAPNNNADSLSSATVLIGNYSKAKNESIKDIEFYNSFFPIEGKVVFASDKQMAFTIDTTNSGDIIISNAKIIHNHRD